VRSEILEAVSTKTAVPWDVTMPCSPAEKRTVSVFRVEEPSVLNMNAVVASDAGRAVAQAVSLRLPTATARV
jgi:hypothetical protein